MDEPKKCSHETALKKLYDGAFVFTSLKTPITENRKGCPTCKKQRAGKFCSECAHQLIDNLPVIIDYKYTGYRLKRINTTLYMETSNSENDCFHNQKPCTLSLEFFMNQHNWSWIWP